MGKSVETFDMKILLPTLAHLFAICSGMPKVLDSKDYDYGLQVGGNIVNSDMKTAADHRAVVLGSIISSFLENHGPDGRMVDDDTGLAVLGHIVDSIVKTAANHHAQVGGHSKDSNVINYRPQGEVNGRLEDSGLDVRGNVQNSNIKTAANHYAKVRGNIEDSKVENLGDEDYGLTVHGNIRQSKVKTAADHRAVVKGNILDSDVYNYGPNGQYYTVNPANGLDVRGNIIRSNMKTAANHDVSVHGNIEDSIIHNYGGNQHVFDKIWYDWQCRPISHHNHVWTPEACKSMCNSHYSCTAVNYSQHYNSCVLRACARPAPEPQWKHGDYQGHIVKY